METSLVPSSKTSLLPALEAGNSAAIARHLAAFKERGIVRHDRTLRIPSGERIPALTQSDEGYDYILTVLTARLTKTMENLNLKRGLNEDQIINLAEKIIEESHDDNLSLEDVLLFLQLLETGGAGKIYDRLDMPVFFELFEVYREERFMSLQYMQYEIDCHYKSLGDTTRTSDGYAENDANTRRVMADYNLKQELNAQSNTVQPSPTA